MRLISVPSVLAKLWRKIVGEEKPAPATPDVSHDIIAPKPDVPKDVSDAREAVAKATGRIASRHSEWARVRRDLEHMTKTARGD